MSTQNEWNLGIIGGTGMLGGAMARAILRNCVVSPDRLWLLNRTGRADGFDGATITSDTQHLVDRCDVVLLCVPPPIAKTLNIRADDRLVLSVMAGILMSDLADITGSNRIVRAMSSPAAEHRLAYSPWMASEAVTDLDKARTQAIFEACGETDELFGEESLIDVFTVMTGPVPGFVAFFAEAVASFAREQGVTPRIADRAVRQLFLAAGKMMATGDMTPADYVQDMIDYAGTTAAGLEAMEASGIKADIATGLAASVARTRTIG